MSSAKLVVGLGNPGKEYEETRHNFGFLTVDFILTTLFSPSSSPCILSSKKDPFELWKGIAITGEQCFLLKPLTYMNKSGEAVQRVSNYYNLSPSDMLVLHDELDLSYGKMKFKLGGGNAGHNGLKSIQQQLGTPDFYRLRLGIGKPLGFDAASYVLGRFSAHQKEHLLEIFKAASETTLLFLKSDIKKAQQYCNSYHLEHSAKAP